MAPPRDSFVSGTPKPPARLWGASALNRAKPGNSDLSLREIAPECHPRADEPVNRGPAQPDGPTLGPFWIQYRPRKRPALIMRIELSGTPLAGDPRAGSDRCRHDGPVADA